MLKIAVDPNELSARIAAVLGTHYRLTPLKVKCTYPVFKGEADGAASVFVKVGPEEEWSRTVSLLKTVGGCGFFSRFVTEEKIVHADLAVFVMEWKESRIVYPEDMTEQQAESFIAGCEKLGEALRGVTLSEKAGEWPNANSSERLYADIVHYIRRHPVAGKLLKGLVSLPEAARAYGNRPCVVIHGDFHAKNFGFEGDAFAAVYDFDKLTYGLACSDLVNALVERFSCLGLSQSARRRLRDVTRRIVALAPWPREDLAVACNVARLQFAARRVRKHSAAAWVALDVWRRDRKIREFLDCLETRWASVTSSPSGNMV